MNFSLGGILKGAGGLIGKIPGIGSWVGPAIGLAGGLIEGNKAQGHADQSNAYTDALLARQQQIQQMLMPKYQEYLSTVGTDPYAGYKYDPSGAGGAYDPREAFAKSDEFNSAIGQNLTREIGTINANVTNSSARDAAKAASIRNAYRTGVQEQIKLMAGSRERSYEDYKQRQNSIRAAMQQAVQPVLSTGPAGVAQNQSQIYQGDSSQQAASLSQAAEAVANSGIFGPRGGKTGSKRGDSTSGNNKGVTNPAANQGMQRALGTGPNMGGPAWSVNPIDFSRINM